MPVHNLPTRNAHLPQDSFNKAASFYVQRKTPNPALMATALFVGTDKGAFLFRSHDRVHWQQEAPQFKGWKVTAIGRARDGRFVAGSASHVYGPLLHLSDDLTRWSAVDQGPRYTNGRKLEQIWTITATQRGHYAGVAEAGLFFAVDPEGPWVAVPGLNDHPTRPAWQPGLGGLCAHVVLENPVNPDQLWCGISAVGVFRSDDGGESWHPKNRGVPIAIPDKEHKEVGFCVHGLALDPRDPSVLYRQDHLGMFRSTDAGDSWQHSNAGLPADFGFPVVADPHTGVVYAYPLESDEYRLPMGGAMAVYRTTDQAQSWVARGQGLAHEGGYASVLRGSMAVDDQSGIYFGTTAGTVHYSTSGGDVWHQLPCLLPRILCVKAFNL